MPTQSKYACSRRRREQHWRQRVAERHDGREQAAPKRDRSRVHLAGDGLCFSAHFPSETLLVRGPQEQKKQLALNVAAWFHLQKAVMQYTAALLLIALGSAAAFAPTALPMGLRQRTAVSRVGGCVVSRCVPAAQRRVAGLLRPDRLAAGLQRQGGARGRHDAARDNAR